MVSSSERVLWKGAISFGLVHIPVALHAATQEQGLDFDWLDKRSMDPVGYKRINKKTGEEIDAENIVKGLACEDGRYVIITPEEIAVAYPKTTQTIAIESSVPADAVPCVYFERPDYIAPVSKADKVYALLREILKKPARPALPGSSSRRNSIWHCWRLQATRWCSTCCDGVTRFDRPTDLACRAVLLAVSA